MPAFVTIQEPVISVGYFEADHRVRVRRTTRLGRLDGDKITSGYCDVIGNCDIVSVSCCTGRCSGQMHIQILQRCRARHEHLRVRLHRVVTSKP